MTGAGRKPDTWSNGLVLVGFVVFTVAVGYLAGQVTAPNIPTW